MLLPHGGAVRKRGFAHDVDPLRTSSLALRVTIRVETVSNKREDGFVRGIVAAASLDRSLAAMGSVPGCGFIERQHSCEAEDRVEPTILCTRCSRSGETNPDLNRSQRGNEQRSARQCLYSAFDMVMQRRSVHYRNDDAGIEQIFHFLSTRSDTRRPNSHGPTSCIALMARSTSRP